MSLRIALRQEPGPRAGLCRSFQLCVPDGRTFDGVRVVCSLWACRFYLRTTWHSWDRRGVGGENAAAEDLVTGAEVAAVRCLRQGFVKQLLPGDVDQIIGVAWRAQRVLDEERRLRWPTEAGREAAYLKHCRWVVERSLGAEAAGSAL